MVTELRFFCPKFNKLCIAISVICFFTALIIVKYISAELVHDLALLNNELIRLQKEKDMLVLEWNYLTNPERLAQIIKQLDSNANLSPPNVIDYRDLKQ